MIVTGYLVEPYAEKEDAEKHEKTSNGRLSRIFSDNIRRTYELKDDNMFAKAGAFGYIVD